MGALAEEVATSRDQMVDRQVASRGVADPLVLSAMRDVPREVFLPDHLREFAYEDSPLPIAAGQTISQPYIVARMIELAEIRPGDRVLEVGAGSGYAAAVMSRIAARVFAIERHGVLANAAREHLAELGYDNVRIYHRDGTAGLPEEAPFDAIIVSAAGPRVPNALTSQLAIGGRLVIPVGTCHSQVLGRIVRRDEKTFEKEDHGFVAFVPLVDENGVEERAHPRRRDEYDDTPTLLHGSLPVEPTKFRRRTARRRQLSSLIAEAAEPFADFQDLSTLVDRYAERKVVLLGESTHGTSEFYQARAWITERLVALHGFNVVAVEADWPDAAAYDAYVRQRSTPPAQELRFTRFPRWMWRNSEIYAFLDRLRRTNESKPDKRAWAGFYGLDIYSLRASMDAVLVYLDDADPQAARVARERYACLAPWRGDPARYGRMALGPGFERCEAEVTAVLRELLAKRLAYVASDGESFFDAERNASTVARAERYYRAVYHGSAASWNLRDLHMLETLQALLAHRGAGSKAVVWAHNSHIGDASFTEMGRVRGEHNLGQLCRRQFGADAALIGFGTDRGTVAAASEWGGPMEIKTVRPAHARSFEAHCRASELPTFFLDLGISQTPQLRAALMRPLLQRAIGVVYLPDSELTSHYFEAETAQQFDAWIWCDETRALSAVHAAGETGEEDTFPIGL